MFARMKFLASFIVLVIGVLPSLAQTNSISLTTLNCYWFFNSEEIGTTGETPKTDQEYDLKAGHLIGLLPTEAPLLVGLQEIGNGKDVAKLVHAANARYKRSYAPLFVQGRDTATKQDVGAFFDTSRGWSVYGGPSRVSDLERELSKHLVVRLTNAVTHIDICVVHLRVPRDADGKAKQVEQNRALLRWCMRHLAQDPKANVVILGDFNENKVGSPEQSLAVLFQAKPPMRDPFESLKTKITTHAGGGAYDRIILSDAIVKGLNHLEFESVSIGRHSRGRGDERRLYTDHFPVTVRLIEQ